MKVMTFLEGAAIFAVAANPGLCVGSTEVGPNCGMNSGVCRRLCLFNTVSPSWTATFSFSGSTEAWAVSPTL